MSDAFWSTVFGSALGVIAGVLIQFLGEWVTRARANKNVRKSLRKEMTYNLNVIDQVGNALRAYRDAINGDSPENALTYMPCNLAIHVQTNNLIATGRIYDFFTEENIQKLFNVTQFLSAPNGQFFYGELEKFKHKLLTEPNQQTKSEIVTFLNWGDGRVASIRTDLRALSAAFAS